MAASGKEIAAHRHELDRVLTKIANEHSNRCRLEGDPCEWAPGWLDGVCHDLDELLERYHVRRKAADPKVIYSRSDTTANDVGVPGVGTFKLIDPNDAVIVTVSKDGDEPSPGAGTVTNLGNGQFEYKLTKEETMVSILDIRAARRG